MICLWEHDTIRGLSKGENQMNYSRIIGNNVTLELEAHSMELSELRKKMGYSTADSRKLVEGRLFLPPSELSRIAQVLGVTKDALITDRGSEQYSSLIHNFRDFKRESNQELVLDLIDMYADLAEML